MKEIYSEVIQFRGNHYDFGYEQGKQLKDSLTIHNRNRQWKKKRARFVIDIDEAKKAFMTFAPQIWDEFEGLQAGLEMPMEDVLRNFGGYRVEPERSGCSIMTGTDYMVRNYDFHPQTYDGRYTFFQPTDGGYAVVGPSSRITGRMDGMNEEGLVMGYNFTHRKKTHDGFVCYMIGRMILETCANVDEAVALLKEIPHRNAFSYVMIDSSEVTYVVEASPRGVKVRESNVSTNHFEVLTDENRNHLIDSQKRQTVIEDHLDEWSEAKQAFNYFNDSSLDLFSDKYKSWSGTIHTTAYFPKEKVAWFTLGGDKEPVVFDFEKWLNGTDVSIERIYGEVNTTLGFANMDAFVR
ncbi:acyl-CoA--6-aminopenicillanic acid acyltransferase [Halalkalibacillus sediminis]|uniref:Acyl-CoA--6-aminopenicillanic acid acyltransferase n=1 Tax=Halalkalibacillus sediminis TaxID=2018042 RepID=A0A2I0QTC8_9BACI|nr:C45 family autoproteolytic acyltransferase/hydolase [Halalkalibacillus sediminis]PKR77605.1 acyl-CoA--6-aminopenicillanic acid acyltransferase [Halalkalibacillus sediminis]